MCTVWPHSTNTILCFALTCPACCNQTRNGKSVRQQLVQCCASAYQHLKELLVDQAQAAQEYKQQLSKLRQRVRDLAADMEADAGE